MRRCVFAAIAVLSAVCAPTAQAAEVDRPQYRYTRSLESPSSGRAAVLEPDGAMFAHSAPGFADLRILDARGQQMPWRTLAQPDVPDPQPIRVLNSGRLGGAAVALFDLGPRRQVREQLVLETPQRSFVGRAIVLGADRRQGPFTRLAATGIYDIRDAARPGRSTVLSFPPSDFRYLRVRATGIRQITGASAVTAVGDRPKPIVRRPRSTSRTERATRTVLTLDYGFARLPIDELELMGNTARYDRAVSIFASDDGRRFVPLSGGRISRFPGSRTAPLAVGARHRYLRVVIENGDDDPLTGLRAVARSRSRALLIEGAHPRPFTLLYGNRSAVSPNYEFARLPLRVAGAGQVVNGSLGAERPNPIYERPPDTRSFSARHPETVLGALAVAAVALGAAGLAALRRRA